MRSIEDTVCEIDELIVREQDMLKDARMDGGGNSVGAGMSMGALEVLRELKEWIMEV